jgi:hypothetical protein
MQGVVLNNSFDPLAGGPSNNTIFKTSQTLNNSFLPPATDRPIVDKSVTGPSKILSRKWREKDLSLHRQKLAEMKPVTFNHPTAPVFINK